MTSLGGDNPARRPLSEAERRLLDRTVRRERLFLALSVLGVAVAAALGAYWGYRRWSDPGFPLGARAVLVVMILLNARLNLRQYRFARLLAKLEKAPSC